MSKKKQKKRSAKHVPSMIDRPLKQAARTPMAETPRPTTSGVTFSRAQQLARAQRPGLVTDYSYVAADLKRIAIIAGSMFALIILLAFVIR